MQRKGRGLPCSQIVELKQRSLFLVTVVFILVAALAAADLQVS
jgi:hypothetical protein